MSKETEYRANAAKVIGLANRASTTHDKGRLLEMAEKWIELADRAHRLARRVREGKTGIVMRPVLSRGLWRVLMKWPGRPIRHFGRFESEAEAIRWIAEHRWLEKQNLERPPETTDSITPNV